MNRQHRHTKPENLIYGLEDRPPRLITLVLASQHLIMLAPRLLYPVVIVQGFDGGIALAQNMVVMSMIAGGIGTILQALRKGPVGLGVLDPAGCGAAYVYPSIHAGGGAGTNGIQAVIASVEIAADQMIVDCKLGAATIVHIVKPHPRIRCYDIGAFDRAGTATFHREFGRPGVNGLVDRFIITCYCVKVT